MFVHVLVPVVLTNHRIQLEHHPVSLAPTRDPTKLGNVLSTATADLGVCGFVETVARDGEDVEVASVFLDPVFTDQGTVGHDGHGFQTEFSFGVVDHGPKLRGVQKRFTTGEVDLFHARVGEEFEGLFRVTHGGSVAVCIGVETEATFV